MNNKLLKATALALVLVGSLQGMVWASAGNQPGYSLYPDRMASGKMDLTVTSAEITEAKPEMESVQKHAGGCDDCDPIRDRDRDGICDCDDCDPIRDRDRDRDGTCDCDVCDPIRDRDRDGICDGDVCEPIRDRDRDGTCDGDDCEPIRGQDRDRDGGGQGGGGHH